MDYTSTHSSQYQNQIPSPTTDRSPGNNSSNGPNAIPAASQPPPALSQAPESKSSTGTAAAPRIRRRNRMITSCLECRRRKLKCDKSHPCTNCVKFTRDCVFLAPALDQASQLKLTEIKEKVGSLERLLERDVAKNVSNANSQGGRSAGGGEDGVRVKTEDGKGVLPGDEDDDLPANEDEKDLEPTPLAVVDAAYGEEGEDDELLDLGIQMGKMRITERIGGFFRPKISEEISYAFLRPRDGSSDSDLESSSLPPVAEWLKPGPSYITPSSGFFFGTAGQQNSLVDFLPSRLAADRLIKQYFTSVHTICQILHRPTFEKEYDTFWDEVSLGIEPPSSVQAIVFAAMFSGVVSMDEPTIIRDFGVSQASLIENFKLGTETALARANFLRTTKIETLQAFVMYLIPLCRAELSRAHSVLLGAAVRMAECMGLHRDGETYGMNPLETHVRRLVWHQLCFLDIRTCEAQGPRPSIRRDEFDTKLPLNVDDVDLHAAGKPPAFADRWTDSTFSLIRFELNEMMRTIWIDRPRIERRKISLTAVLSKIETFKSNMAAKYDHLMDERIPVQKCAKIIKAMLISRLYIMVLHRYHNSVVSPMPDRLRNIMITAGLSNLENAVALETMPDVRPWYWYLGALQQYHTAFLLLMEVFVYPQRKEADRIWNCLDYIFECDPSEDRRTKGLRVLAEIQQKTAIYSNMRGMRAPVQMNKHLGLRAPRNLGASDLNKEEGAEGQQEKELIYLQSPSGGAQIDAQQPLRPGNSTSIGRAPLPDVVFAGVSNGQSLWALPTQQMSPESSDTHSPFTAMENTPMMNAGGGTQDDLMAEVDWDAFDALFPDNGQSDMGVSSFLFPSSATGGPLFPPNSTGGPLS